MSSARQQIYSLADKLAKDIYENGLPWHGGSALEAGSVEDTRLHGLLNIVERDAVHRAAMKLRETADRYADSTTSDLVAKAMSGALYAGALGIDPYVRLRAGETTGPCTEWCIGDEHWHLKEDPKGDAA